MCFIYTYSTSAFTLSTLASKGFAAVCSSHNGKGSCSMHNSDLQSLLCSPDVFYWKCTIDTTLLTSIYIDWASKCHKTQAVCYNLFLFHFIRSLVQDVHCTVLCFAEVQDIVLCFGKVKNTILYFDNIIQKWTGSWYSLMRTTPFLSHKVKIG